MNIQQRSRKEYMHRINRVVDYVDANLNEEHSLNTLSSIAHFSPFHFHRIFKALTGETIHTYVKRMRLQRAGSMLITDYDRPVSDIALCCGFNSPEVFCRAFR
jgi:AraC family transcriptional regulator